MKRYFFRFAVCGGYPMLVLGVLFVLHGVSAALFVAFAQTESPGRGGLKNRPFQAPKT